VTSNETVAVFGAYGHTGRFVVAELHRRGWTPILSGRDPARLNALGDRHPGLDLRPACVDDAASLDRALVGATSVINCAGPFARTSAPLIEAALRAKMPYLDVAAEIEANADTFEQYAGRAREAGIATVPAMAFYGGLGDLFLRLRPWETGRPQMKSASHMRSAAGSLLDEGLDRSVEAAEGRPAYRPLEPSIGIAHGRRADPELEFPGPRRNANSHRRIHHGG
jgi:NAD(P)-dependent dehydrogenase (short-subunit alcohol dehydrogenase family)